ncbi:MAG: 50S ribosomal protein L10 [Acidimicrobiia bacterium]
MPRPEKVQAVAEIKERLEGAQAVFLAEYAGLSVKDQQVLRRELRANGAEFKVVKMTLARRAADDLEIETLDELLLGPTGLAFADGDPVRAAKVLKDFAKSHDVFVIKGGLLGLEFLTPERISELADIEPREVLLAKLAGAMKAPMVNMAGLLAALPRNTASVLSQLLERKESAETVAASTDARPEAEAEDDTSTAPADVIADAPTDAPADADASVDATPDDAVAPEDSDTVAEAPSGDAAEDPDVTEETEDDADATVTASDDSADETVDEHDEASDDAEEK